MAPPAGKKPRGTRNQPVVRGVGRYSRSAMYHKRGIWALKAKHGGSFPTTAKPVKDAKDGAKEVRAPRFYPADPVRKPLHKNVIVNPPRLRASITPGTVLILLAGRFKGKRVVFLKQLESGLLLITGPFNVSGVPLRRVNQVYVIATSTKIDISSVDVSKYKDSHFSREVVKKKKTENEFFAGEKQEKEEKTLPADRKEDQSTLDKQLGTIIEKVPELKSYLGARFSLKSGVKPHELVF